MSERLFEKIVREVEVSGTEAVVPFFRGEPLLHPAFPDMMRLLREKTAAKIQLATNALLLSRSIATALLELRIDFISFSLDALNEWTYKKVRPGGDFHRVLENVHGFLRMREEQSDPSTIVQVSATEGPHNEAEMESFITYWKDKVDRVRIYPQHSDKGEFGRLEQLRYRRPEASRTPCRKPFTDIVIYSDGDAALCNHDWDRKAKDAIGSVSEHSIQEIWENPAYTKIRNQHLNGLWNEVNPCGHCDHWQGGDDSGSSIGLLVQSKCTAHGA